MKTTEAQRRAKMKWRKAHPEHYAEWREKNREKTRAAETRYRKKNLGKYAAKEHRRRAQKRTTLLTRSERAAVSALYRKAQEMTLRFGEPYHVDHIKPLAKGGAHHPSNLQILRRSENLVKGDSFCPIEI